MTATEIEKSEPESGSIVCFTPTIIRLTPIDRGKSFGMPRDLAAMKITVRLEAGRGHLLDIVDKRLKIAEEDLITRSTENTPERLAEWEAGVLEAWRVPRTYAQSLAEFREFLGVTDGENQNKCKLIHNVTISTAQITYAPFGSIAFKELPECQDTPATGITYRWNRPSSLKRRLRGNYREVEMGLIDPTTNNTLGNVLVNTEKFTYLMAVQPLLSTAHEKKNIKVEGDSLVPVTMPSNVTVQLEFTMVDARD